MEQQYLNQNPLLVGYQNHRQQVIPQMVNIHPGMQNNKTFQKIEEEARRIQNTDNALVEKIIVGTKTINKRNEDVLMEFEKRKVKQEMDKREWETQRVNNPYKSILRTVVLQDEDYTKVKREEDIVIHKVSKEDHDVEKLSKELKIKEDDIEKHNEELKLIFNVSDFTKHTRKFQYANRYKFQEIADTLDHSNMKKDSVEMYKEEQCKMEEGKKNLDSILDILIKKNTTPPEPEVDIKNIKFKSIKPKMKVKAIVIE